MEASSCFHLPSPNFLNNPSTSPLITNSTSSLKLKIPPFTTKTTPFFSLIKCHASSTVQTGKPHRHHHHQSVGPTTSPVYSPTPPDRDLRTPHSGYHFDGTARKFFEGWYFKVSIPERRQSFCFMYSVENPAFRGKLTTLEMLQYGNLSTGVGAQILGAYDKYICQYARDSPNFWGNRHELMLGNTFVAEKGMNPPSNEVPPKEFNKKVSQGFQVTPLWHQGCICDDGQIMWKLSKLHVGSTVLALFMDGVILGLSRSRQQVGLLLFLCLNPIGKYACHLDFQQLKASQSSVYRITGLFGLDFGCQQTQHGTDSNSLDMAVFVRKA